MLLVLLQFTHHDLYTVHGVFVGCVEKLYTSVHSCSKRAHRGGEDIASVKC